MKSEKTDRRSERTRRLLGEALVALMLEKRYEAITVQDILDRANVGRATFYEHYWDKEDLFTSEIERVIDLFSRQMEPSKQDPSTWIPSLALFQHIRDYHRLFQALLRGRGIEIGTQVIRDRLRSRVKEQLREELQGPDADASLEAVSSYVAGAFLTLLQWWLETEMAWSPERMDALFYSLVLPGVRQVFRQEINGSSTNTSLFLL